MAVARYDIMKLLRICLFGGFVLLVILFPIVLLFVGTKQPGIDLSSALKGNWTFEPFIRLFIDSDDLAVNFRAGLLRSFEYSSIVALVAAFTAFFYVSWVTGWPRKSAIGLSFTLLTFTLLPQTYLIMPVLLIKQNLSRSLDPLVIILMISFGVIPLIAWMLHLMDGSKIVRLQGACASDRLSISKSLAIILGESKLELLIVILLGGTIAWGNYLVPYALGSQNTYTAVVQVATFTTNLGRDWAMICAAGFVVALPGVILGIMYILLSIRRSPFNAK